jgi:thymidylate synthase (FAD)
MGSDAAIVQAARVSYGHGTKTPSDDRALIRYLMRHAHTTPFEMVEFKFHVRCPIFVARQWLRHRTASVNEVSARYSLVPDEYFVPERLRAQLGRQTSAPAPLENDTLLRLKQKASCDLAFHTYDELISRGCSRELARTHLPQSTYTEFYWKINLHNLLHFLELRLDNHAQPEITEVAKLVYEAIKTVVPMACEAFEDYRLGAVTLNRLELTGSAMTKGEQDEFAAKLKKLSHFLEGWSGASPSHTTTSADANTSTS